MSLENKHKSIVVLGKTWNAKKLRETNVKDFGCIRNLKVGHVIVWRGNYPAIIRMKNPFRLDSLHSHFVGACANANEEFNSLHYSNIRFATDEEVKFLGKEDAIVFIH